MGYHYGILMYLNLTTQEQVRKSYGDGVMSAAVDVLPTWSCRVPDRFLDCTGKERCNWIVTARIFFHEIY